MNLNRLRISERQDVEWHTWCRIGSECERIGVVKDVSLGGAGQALCSPLDQVAHDQPITLMTQCDARGPIIELDGKVRWTRDATSAAPALGVEFERVSIGLLRLYHWLRHPAAY